MKSPISTHAALKSVRYVSQRRTPELRFSGSAATARPVVRAV